ncbi:hypothetical protein BGZ74_004215 [Mortierella antarctica]|nr:hypothetical protein BGZ74_004215 [Mortierella antarctica]
MDRIDLSLDDIIRAQKETNKAKAKPNVRSKQGPAVRTKTIQKNNRTRVAVAAMPNLQYAKQVPKEDALFTETFRTMTAPIKEIFTSRYIPNLGPIKLVAINKNPVKRDVSSPRPIHVVVKKESTPARSGLATQGRSVYRPADSYRPSPASSRASRGNTPRSGSRHGSESYPIDTDTFHNSKQNQQGRRRSLYSSHAPSEPAIKIEREKTPALSVGMDVDVPLNLPGLPAIEPPKLEIEPATIEIENLDPGTTAEDVVCSRFGEIKSCICTNGFSQVTYARKAAAIAAMQNLNGKTADNVVAAVHVPSAIAQPLRMVGKTVQGSINQAGALYADQLIAAQQMLKVQQHRMAQLQLEEQRLAQMRSQSQMGS